MLKASWMLLVSAGTLLSATSFADDTRSVSSDHQPLPVVMLSTEALLAELGYASGSQLIRPIEPITFTNDWRRPIADFTFQDNSALARASRLRSLSLLTLAETGRTRVFFGVNDEGLLGLHLSALPSDGDERHVEVTRMPYLQDDETSSQAVTLGPESN